MTNLLDVNHVQDVTTYLHWYFFAITFLCSCFSLSLLFLKFHITMIWLLTGPPEMPYVTVVYSLVPRFLMGGHREPGYEVTMSFRGTGVIQSRPTWAFHVNIFKRNLCLDMYSTTGCCRTPVCFRLHACLLCSHTGWIKWPYNYILSKIKRPRSEISVKPRGGSWFEMVHVLCTYM